MGTVAYGFVRKVGEVAHARVSTYDKELREYKSVPMLFADKAMVVTFSTMMAPFYWPWYVHTDLKLLELRMKNLNPDDYGYGDKDHVVDYMFG